MHSRFMNRTRDKAVLSRENDMMRAITAYELTHVGLDRYGLQFKRTRLKTIGRVCHGRQSVVWTALEAGSRKNKWPEERAEILSARRAARRNDGVGLPDEGESKEKTVVGGVG